MVATIKTFEKSGLYGSNLKRKKKRRNKFVLKVNSRDIYDTGQLKVKNF
jgi:hypothetical protein